MFFNEIVHGTQYYRTPTPLPEEWEGDIANFEGFNLDVFQIRINWRWNEREEGVYDFSDVDRLMDLAEKYNRKVIIKFLLECAPQYVFDKYGGTRIGPRGEQLRGGAHGAFYGGWRPCFTNPDVQKAAVKFVEKVAERYHDRKNLILWNAWNEIRNRPIEDCFCPHCRAAFGRYLKNKFHTIENLNSFYGTAEESFENIALPAMPQGYWDIYEFKKFKGGAELGEWLRFVYDAVRKYDEVHPVMSHVGFTGAFQNNIGDVCDDYTVSKAVDFWGTSIPCATDMHTHENRLDFLMLNDFVRAVNENYFLYEIYPGLGMFKYSYDTPFDMSFKLYGALASGAKGLLYWQYRAERVGHENDCAGIMRVDGSPREVAHAVKDFGADLKKHMSFFVGAKAQKAEIAIVFDFNSMLMSEIEDSCGVDYSFALSDPKFYYRNAHTGMYRLLHNSNYNVDYVGVTEPEKFEDYKVLYFPYYTMLDVAIVPYLQRFLEKGGIVIADEGFGMRTPNTWMQPYDIACKPIMTARIRERRLIRDEQIEYQGQRANIRPYKTQYNVENAEVLMHFADGFPAVHRVNYGKGKLYLFGFSIGYSYYEGNDKIWESIMADILSDADVKKYAYSDCKSGIYEKRLKNGNNEIVFIFNNSESEKQIEMEDDIVSCGGFGCVEGKHWKIPAHSMAYVVI